MIPHDTITNLPGAIGSIEADSAPSDLALSLAEFAETDTAKHNAATWDFRKRKAADDGVDSGAKWPALTVVRGGCVRLMESLPPSSERGPREFATATGTDFSRDEQAAFFRHIVAVLAGYEATREALRVERERLAGRERLLDVISGQYPDGDEWAADQYQHGSRLCAAVMEWRAIRAKGGA